MKNILFILGLFAITYQVFPQSVIYKSNGEAISVYNLNVSGKNLSYNLPGDAEDTKRLMSTTIVDSIKHEHGSTDVFLKSGISDIFPEDKEQPFNRFLLGADVAAVAFYNNLKVSFEYLPGKGFIGLYAAHSINTSPVQFFTYEDFEVRNYYGNIMRLLNWNSRAGINAYLFPPGSFRLSLGLQYARGSFTEEINKQLDKEPWTVTTSRTNIPFSGLFLSPGLNWQWNSYLRFTLAYDFGLYKKPIITSKPILRSEISLNF
jgi:hypothetical protein